MGWKKGGWIKGTFYISKNVKCPLDLGPALPLRFCGKYLPKFFSEIGRALRYCGPWIVRSRLD